MKRIFGKNLRAASYQEDDELVSNESSIIGSDYDDDSSSEYMAPRTKRLRTINTAADKKIERKPTRVPNMKINNRNALLARENRKRKKELMESLEKNVETLQAENKALHKIMKSKDVKIEKLIGEVKYLKSVIANSPEIVSILKSLPTTAIGNKKAESKEISDEKSSGSLSDDTLSCNTFNEDNDLDDVATQWDEMLNNPLNTINDFSDVPNINDSMSPLSEISTDHNYSHFDTNHKENLPGLCLHINTGRVSLEFCSVCHDNATNSWTENI